MAKNTPPGKDEQAKIEAQLKAMLDALESGKLDAPEGEGWEQHGESVVGWAGTCMNPETGQIATKEEMAAGKGKPYPVQGLYRGLFRMKDAGRQNPWFYVIEVTRPTFVTNKADGTFIAKPGDRIGYGVRSTLNLTSFNNGDKVFIRPLRKQKTGDSQRDYWTFDVQRIQLEDGKPAPNALLPYLPVQGDLVGEGEDVVIPFS